MQPIALVVLDQGGNIMIDPDLSVTENATPVNADAKAVYDAQSAATTNNIPLKTEAIMKALRVSLLLAMVFGGSSFGQTEAQSLRNKEIAIPVRDLNIKAQNIHLLLSKIAYLYSVPISLEVASDDELLKSKHLKVQIRIGTLANVLDSIVRQKPNYKWK